MTTHRALLLAVVLTAGACTGAPGQDDSPPPTPEAATPTATADPSPTSASPAADDVPSLADAPSGDVSLWLDTIGIPVVAAVRTSTPLAELAEVAPDHRTATCRQVATDLDGIASSQVLAALAITADAETATLLVGDLQAKGDLLAACEAGGDELDQRIAEVEHTHAVAVAWLAQLRSDP